MSKVDDLISAARNELGKPYVFGDEGPDSFDCSGLMQYVYGEVGVSLPRTAAEQQKAASPVSSPLPGDLVFWGNPASHVALYIGDNKIIAAPHSGATVQVENVYGNPTYGRVSGLGTATAPIAGAAQTAVGLGLGQLNSLVTGVFGSGRKVVLEALAAGLGLALVGAGLWKSLKPARARVSEEVEQII